VKPSAKWWSIPLGLLDWDDSQTDLAHLGGVAPGAAKSEGDKLWEDNWDDDDIEEEFSAQLRYALSPIVIPPLHFFPIGMNCKSRAREQYQCNIEVILFVSNKFAFVCFWLYALLSLGAKEVQSEGLTSELPSFFLVLRVE
jgi:DSS1/SEM1 family